MSEKRHPASGRVPGIAHARGCALSSGQRAAIGVLDLIGKATPGTSGLGLEKGTSSGDLRIAQSTKLNACAAGSTVRLKRLRVWRP